jgi:L1 cell adhesion molecule like protein
MLFFLICQAWRDWEKGEIEELFDQALFDETQLVEIKRCVEVGLLCAQEDPANRPTMADVLQMLCGLKEIPTPKKLHHIGQDVEEYYVTNYEHTWSVTSPPSPSAFSDVSLSPR